MKKATVITEENVTKVVCPYCHGEIAIGEHEHMTMGMAIGKDSGIGTVVLPPATDARHKEVDESKRKYFIDYFSLDECDVTHAWLYASTPREAIQEFFHGHWGVACITAVDEVVGESRRSVLPELMDDIAFYLNHPNNNKQNSNQTSNGMKKETVSAFDKLMAMCAGNTEALAALNTLKQEMDGKDYIPVDGMIRRYLPSHVLKMVQEQNDGSFTFYEQIQRRGYDYSWDVLIREFKVQYMKHKSREVEGFADRARFYNKSLAVCMANHFINELQKHWDELATHKHEGRKYRRLPVIGLNDKQGVHENEFESKVLDHLKAMVVGIKNAETPEELLVAVKEFNKRRSTICWVPAKSCIEFCNTYKAAGAYYTMKDLIKNEGCRLKADENDATYHYWCCKNLKMQSADDSLRILDKRIEELTTNPKYVWNTIQNEGFNLFGLLLDFLSYNNVNLNDKLADWKQQSIARREARKSNKSRRY